MEMVVMEFRFAKESCIFLHFSYWLVWLDFFLEQSRLRLLYIKRIFTDGSFSSQYLSKIQLWITVDDYSFIVVDGTIDLKKNRFLENSWLKVAINWL
jgi:hypothetical protein